MPKNYIVTSDYLDSDELHTLVEDAPTPEMLRPRAVAAPLHSLAPVAITEDEEDEGRGNERRSSRTVRTRSPEARWTWMVAAAAVLVAGSSISVAMKKGNSSHQPTSTAAAMAAPPPAAIRLLEPAGATDPTTQGAAPADGSPMAAKGRAPTAPAADPRARKQKDRLLVTDWAVIAGDDTASKVRPAKPEPAKPESAKPEKAASPVVAAAVPALVPDKVVRPAPTKADKFQNLGDGNDPSVREARKLLQAASKDTDDTLGGSN